MAPNSTLTLSLGEQQPESAREPFLNTASKSYYCYRARCVVGLLEFPNPYNANLCLTRDSSNTGLSTDCDGS